MTVRVGINGFGRIGRCVFRAAMGNDDFEVVGINDLIPEDNLAYLLKYDSVHGRLENDVEGKKGALTIDGREIPVTAIKDPSDLKWGEFGADVVLESTGLFTDAEDARKHLEAGAKKVIISAPATNEDYTVVLVVNDDGLDPKSHDIVSNASCTTNCLAPVVKVLHEEFGVENGLVTTVHSYTNNQAVLDSPAGKWSRGRAAAENIIPTTTGAAKAVGKVLPELDGRLNGMAMRVPTPNVSVVDFVANLSREVTEDEVNAAFERAARGELKGILGYTETPLVSRDFNGDPHSSYVDATSTMVVEGSLVKVISWYDNEWGFSHRMIELAFKIGEGL